MSNFKKFIQIVKSKGGIWGRDNIMFSQTRDLYSASYKPNYPDDSPHDQTLELNHITGMWSHYGAKEQAE